MTRMSMLLATKSAKLENLFCSEFMLSVASITFSEFLVRYSDINVFASFVQLLLVVFSEFSRYSLVGFSGVSISLCALEALA